MDLISTTVTTVSPADPNKKFCLLDQVRDDLFSADNVCNTFVLLDACKVIFLQDRAQMAGLPHACLYQGQAQEEYGDYAPWILQIDPDAVLTTPNCCHIPEESPTNATFCLLAREYF